MDRFALVLSLFAINTFLMTAAAATPQPYVVQPSSTRAGIDGNWSTFLISVGTPPQTFQIIPSTSLSESWVPLAQTCSRLPSSLHCGQSRGSDSLVPSNGFHPGKSTSWNLLGIYGLSGISSLITKNYTAPGFYGRDTIVIGTSAPETLPHQLLAGTTDFTDFWLGTLGLGIKSKNFIIGPPKILSLVSYMKASNLIPSLSFGYRAGAAYQSSLGSLILGGYDKSAFESVDKNIDVDIDVGVKNSDYRDLQVSILEITARDSTGRTVVETVNGSSINAAIDSTVSQMWLPLGVCDQLAATFNLTYDRITGLYTLNASAYQKLQDMNPTFTFKIAAADNSNGPTEITLPYAALDLVAEAPIYNQSTPYFPIRRAMNDSQLTLGRVFLQNAYLVVDWERNKFTIGPSSINEDTYDIETISSKGQGNSDQTEASSHKRISAGAIAGIAVGAMSCLASTLAATWFYRRRRRSARALAATQNDDLAKSSTAELPGDHITGKEAMSSDVLQLHGQAMKHLAMSSEVFELQGTSAEQELEVPAAVIFVRRSRPPPGWI